MHNLSIRARAILNSGFQPAEFRQKCNTDLENRIFVKYTQCHMSTLLKIKDKN